MRARIHTRTTMLIPTLLLSLTAPQDLAVQPTEAAATSSFDWTQWNGPAGEGVSAESAWKDEGTALWSAEPLPAEWAACFDAEVDRLEALLGWELDAWRAPRGRAARKVA